MSYTSRELNAPVDLVWQTLIDPSTYPEWLVGAEKIRSIDPDWPQPGSSFHHSVGIGPLTINDRTTVKSIDRHRLLELSVRARPLIAAVARFRLVSDGQLTVVSIEEEPEVPIIGELVRPLLDPSTHIRNHRSLRQLEEVVAGRAVLAVAGAGSGATGGAAADPAGRS